MKRYILIPICANEKTCGHCDNAGDWPTPETCKLFGKWRERQRKTRRYLRLPACLAAEQKEKGNA